ncbi:MAG: penicillin-binding protein 2 [Clostridiales bacterium]|jgi:peptidoglycan glycosyltransferase|nr:penicillin-binding protein 2 [Clostridiales bacterium]
MEGRKKNIRRVFWLYFVLFIALQIYLTKLIAYDSLEIRVNPHNPRLNMFDKDIKRGDIKDSGGAVLVESTAIDGGYKRIYNEPEAFSNVLGNVSHQKTGIEAKYNFVLSNLSLDIWQRAKDIMTDSGLKADSVVLTIDSAFQSFLYNELEGYKGAVVCIEPGTGKVLAMVTRPGYNANTIAEDWEGLIADEENSPLLNRASSGLYPPGSTFKIVSALAIIRGFPEYNSYSYTCSGAETIDGVTIGCYNNNAHGEVNLESALTHSCNTYFFHMMQNKITAGQLAGAAAGLLFNEYYGYPLEYSKSSFVLNDSSDTSERGQTAIGQGKTLMSPMHIALITSAVANGGIMMEPYFLGHVESYTGAAKNKTAPKKIAQVMTTEEAGILTKMMVGVVESGTGRDAKIEGLSMAGKTGTAENSTGVDHNLFTVFAPVDHPKIAVSVIVEQGADTGKALSIAKAALGYYLK